MFEIAPKMIGNGETIAHKLNRRTATNSELYSAEIFLFFHGVWFIEDSPIKTKKSPK